MGADDIMAALSGGKHCIECGQLIYRSLMQERVAAGAHGPAGWRTVEVWSHVGGHERCEGRDTLATPPPRGGRR